MSARIWQRNAHHLLWIIPVLLVLCFILIIGYFGFLGEMIQSPHKNAADVTDKFFKHHGSNLETAAKIMGALGTLTTASWGIVASIIYSEKFLPRRLLSDFQRAIKPLESYEAAAVAVVSSTADDIRYRSELVHVGPLNRALDLVGISNFRRARGTIDAQLEDLEKSIQAAGAACPRALVPRDQHPARVVTF